MMPAALSELCAYSQNCITLLRPLIPKTPDEQRIIGELAEIPPIPYNALFTLRESVEFGGDQLAEAIADLISRMQIQHARATSVKGRLLSQDKIVVRTNIVDYIVDCLEVFARASKLFAYARRETDEAPGPLTCGDVRTAAHACDIWEEDGDIFARISTRFGGERA
jgi:hypothetical protein